MAFKSPAPYCFLTRRSSNPTTADMASESIKRLPFFLGSLESEVESTVTAKRTFPLKNTSDPA